VDCEPLKALLPDQPPEATHEVALEDDQVSVALAPLAIALGPTLTLTVGSGALTETVADWDALPPAPVQVNVYVEFAVSAPEDCDPLKAWLPDQAPEAEQEVALADDQAIVDALPLEIELGLALILTVGAGELTVTVADWVALPPKPVQVNV
jgi:hypothetical protein